MPIRTERVFGDFHIHLPSDLDARNPNNLSPNMWATEIVRRGYRKNIRYFAFTPHHHGLLHHTTSLQKKLDAISDIDFDLITHDINAILPKTPAKQNLTTVLDQNEVVILQGFEATCIHFSKRNRRLCVSFPHVLCYIPSAITLEFLSAGTLGGQPFPGMMSIRKLSDKIHQAGGACIAAHPIPDNIAVYHRWSLSIADSIRAFHAAIIDGAEYYNGKTSAQSQVSEKEMIHLRKNLVPPYRNSDAHSVAEFKRAINYQTRNVLHPYIQTPDQLIEQILHIAKWNRKAFQTPRIREVIV